MMKKNFQTLLPSTAGGVLATLCSLLQTPEIEDRIKQLWDPHECPEDYLPWLAWALSVDEWDDKWSDAVKREVINQAFSVHRYKGTPAAIEQALATLNIESNIKEWWELPDGTPGTATVWALINDNLGNTAEGLLSKAMLERIQRIIAMVKRGSIHVDLKLGLSLKETVGVAAFTQPSTALMNLEGQLSAVLPDETRSGVGITGGFHSHYACRDQVADGLGVVPDPLNATFYCDGVLKQTHLHERVVAGSGVSPDELSGRVAVGILVTRCQLQHFDFIGSA
ncbi:phage tail protein I [Pseudoalteromonas xiamenensis]|uniref:phage tail protein I n=1 Tax=Pseudoalteromonas xiamenensis TaxID=882626 RepID=UPI0027E44B83|nr:phage tail protein I [Pseudoalteromonas xiamenensis]WMN59289.1 phage tail protein I [Pseudoalteromonas xiamenensis]